MLIFANNYANYIDFLPYHFIIMACICILKPIKIRILSFIMQHHLPVKKVFSTVLFLTRSFYILTSWLNQMKKNASYEV